MLSRVANSLYWMTRYIERAENIARLVHINLLLIPDRRRINDGRLPICWLPILQSICDEESFLSLYDEMGWENVTHFLVFNRENPSSVFSCISYARENARLIRDQVAMEMWEEINRLYLFLKSRGGREVWESRPHDFLQEILRSSLYLNGLACATFARDEGWHFMQVGRFLERADKTTRVLDLRHQSVAEMGAPTLTTQVDSSEWASLLRSCSAWDGYRQVYSLNVTPTNVTEYLLLSENFPRSVCFCAAGINASLRAISGIATGSFSNDAEKLSGRLLAELQFGTAQEIFAYGFHDYLDRIQEQLNCIGEAVVDFYVVRTIDPPFGPYERQQEQQQQQRISTRDCVCLES